VLREYNLQSTAYFGCTAVTENVVLEQALELLAVVVVVAFFIVAMYVFVWKPRKPRFEALEQQASESAKSRVPAY